MKPLSSASQSILQKTYDAMYYDDSLVIGRDNWQNTKEGRERVWGEFLRIKHYGQRGDIAADELSTIISNKVKSS